MLLFLLINLIATKSHAAIDKHVELDSSKRILLRSDGLTIGGASFHGGTNQWQRHLASLCRDGVEMACQYDDTLERVKSTVDEMQSLPTNENTEHIMEAVTAITADLLLLGAFHRQHLDSLAAAPFEHGESTNVQFESEHLSRTLGCYHAALYYYTVLWNAQNYDSQIEQGTDEQTSLLVLLYNQNSIALAAFGAALQLSDLYDVYYPIFHQQTVDLSDDEVAQISREGYNLSYRYLLSCEFWCDTSQSLLEYISSHEKDTTGGEDAYEELYWEQLAEQNQLYVYESKQSLAHTNVRIGTLMLTMYAEGYTLTSDEMLSYNAAAKSVLLKSYGYDLGENAEEYSQQIVDSIKEGQERLLLRIIEKIKTGLAMYEKLPVKEYGDNRINLADSRHHLGMAYQYLGDNKSAIEEWRSSLDIYREIFDEYSSPLSSMDMVGISSVADIATSLITTSQQCGDALLMLGEYEETKEMYKFNLKLRRYLDDGTSIEQDLNRDGEDAEADFDESDLGQSTIWPIPLLCYNGH